MASVALTEQADCLVHLGRLDEAVEVLEGMLQQYPKDGRGYNNLGLIVLEQGRSALAEYYFSEAVRLGITAATFNLENARRERAKRKIQKSYFIKKPGR